MLQIYFFSKKKHITFLYFCSIKITNLQNKERLFLPNHCCLIDFLYLVVFFVL